MLPDCLPPVWVNIFQRQIGPIETNRFSNSSNFPTKFFFLKHHSSYRLMRHHSYTFFVGYPRTMRGGAKCEADQGLEAKSSFTCRSASVQNGTLSKGATAKLKKGSLDWKG